MEGNHSTALTKSASKTWSHDFWISARSQKNELLWVVEHPRFALDVCICTLIKILPENLLCLWSDGKFPHLPLFLGLVCEGGIFPNLPRRVDVAKPHVVQILRSPGNNPKSRICRRTARIGDSVPDVHFMVEWRAGV